MKLVETYWERLLENSFPVVTLFWFLILVDIKGLFVFSESSINIICVLLCLFGWCFVRWNPLNSSVVTSCCLLGCFEFHQPLLLINSFEFGRKLRSSRCFFQKAKGVVACCKNLHKVKLQEGGMDLIRYWICIDLASGIEFYTWFFEFCR